MVIRLAHLLLIGSIVVGLPACGFGDSESGVCFRKAYGVLHDEADIRDVGPFRLLVNQDVRDRADCGSDLFHYHLPPDVFGVLFDDCQISWVDGDRTSATEAGIECVPSPPRALTTTVGDIAD